MEWDRPMAWEVTGRVELGAGRVSTFVDETVLTPSGEVMNRQFLTHPGAVAVVCWDEERDAIAVVRQYRHPVRMELVEIPAGLLDLAGEPFVAAAQRELAEEAELAADRWEVLVDICSTPGACEESLRIFLARGPHPVSRPEGFVLEGEEAHMSAAWVGRTELVDAVLAGRCQSPSLVSGVLALETARLAGRLDALRPADAPWPIRDRRG
ncbi:NUDIX hydrolase [Arachnia propionica]|uniref:NUDIX hydrolase n=1 Tax=Arachnia propionica TaxID=1750 RepID=A0A3P1T6Q4_9ACTN|nr:NUDIX hydrolase [Arachnia propionica]RRD04865.1 NUDIX hydrolase [Arachnia propionica]